MTEQELQQQIEALQAEQQRRRQQRIEDYAGQVESVLDELSAEDKGAVMQRLGYEPTMGSQLKALARRSSLGRTDPMESLDKDAVVGSLKGFG